MSYLVCYSPTGGLADNCKNIGMLDLESLNKVASGHLAFRVSGELAESSRLAVSPETTLLLVGRARLDRRKRLLKRLQDFLPLSSRPCSDPELCLAAYARWGEDMAEEIQGDFSFAIWDGRSRRLFCARDQLGVRPLIYFSDGKRWWISDSIEELSQVPGYADGELDPVWVHHFLLYGTGEPSRTVYAHVHRLLPAHTLALADEQAQVRRYWSFNIGEPLLLNGQEAYLERFNELLTTAVRDRMPNGLVGISMSGGLDSTALAAMAVEVAGSAERVLARTSVLDGECDPDFAPSRLVARHLGIQQKLVENRPLLYDSRWQEKISCFAEPNMEIIDPDVWNDERKVMRQVSSVWFYGEGPDNALTYEWRSFMAWLAQHRMWGKLSLSALRYFADKSRTEWAQTIRHRFWPEPKGDRDDRLPWLADIDPLEFSPAHQGQSWRPIADRGWRTQHLWTDFLEGLDCAYARFGIEWRHPFMDLEVLDFMLRAPPIPWAHGKFLLRKAMEDRLPEAVVKTQKFVGRTDAVAQAIRAAPPSLPDRNSPLGTFVPPEKLPFELPREGDVNPYIRLAVVHHWLVN